MESEAENEKILLVDDVPTNLNVLTQMLAGEGFEILAATRGIDALEVAAYSQPDLILLDVMMPDMDGYETCQKLKANPELAHIPVIFLTAKVETEDVVRGFELGAVDYVTKPFNTIELLARVRTHLELKRLQRELEEYNKILEQKVQQRTAELQIAHRKLQLQVKELDGRDRLSHAQISATSIAEGYECILEVVQQVLDVSKARIYRPKASEVQLKVVAAVGLVVPGGFQTAEDLVDELGVHLDSNVSLVAQTYADGKPRAGVDSEIVVPMIYGDYTLGVIHLEGVIDANYDQSDLQEIAWRLAREAGILCHSLELNEELEIGDIDVKALLEIDE